MDQVTIGVVAVGAAVLISLVALIPFVTISYRTRGRLAAGASVGSFALLAYLLALGAYTLLPLPEPGALRCAPAQLRLGATLLEWRGSPGHQADNLQTLLHNDAFQQLALNVVLFLPWGWFVRWLVGRGLLVAAASGLLGSLLVETTQLTGLWGLYRCAYRVFDVDDLLTNTTGAVLGWLLARVILRSRRHDPTNPGAPRPVTIRRRLLSMMLDVLAEWLITVAVALGLVLVAGAAWDRHPSYRGIGLIGAGVALAAQTVSVLVSRSTIGELAVLLKSSPDARRWPLPIALGVRLATGIGGYISLEAFVGVRLPLVGLFVVTSLIAVFVPGGRRGLPFLASGLELVDRRTPGGPAAPLIRSTGERLDRSSARPVSGSTGDPLNR